MLARFGVRVLLSCNFYVLNFFRHFGGFAFNFFNFRHLFSRLVYSTGSTLGAAVNFLSKSKMVFRT